MMDGFIFPFTSRLVKKEKLNYNVVHFSIQRPTGFCFVPGQAVDLSIDRPGCELAVAPFTIISSENDPYLEFVIKIRPDRNSLTYRLASLKLGAVIQLSRPWDTFEYRGNGHFFAAGTGIVPFMAILNSIHGFDPKFTKVHKLFYANKGKEDILFEKRLRKWFGGNFISRLSRPAAKSDSPERVDFEFLKTVVQIKDQSFYICGPKSFELNVMAHLIELGVDRKWIQTGYAL